MKKEKTAQSLTLKRKILLIFLGGIVGFLNGFFGGGGGMVCVPTLEKGLKLPSKKAHATAIAVIFPLSVLSGTIYVVKGVISSLPLLTVGLGVIFGGLLGSVLLKFLPEKIVAFVFAILMFVGGVRMIL